MIQVLSKAMNVSSIIQIQENNGFPVRLINHHKVVSQVTEEIAKRMCEMGVEVDVKYGSDS